VRWSSSPISPLYSPQGLTDLAEIPSFWFLMQDYYASSREDKNDVSKLMNKLVRW
jgi:hypothetical protein